VTSGPLLARLKSMSESSPHTEPLIDLETKISHQEVAIDELKQTVFEQHIAIEKLEKELKRLNDRLSGIDSGPVIGPGNDKPPHY
jgi:uncharacterized coiled-coil protein SlyX